MKERPIIFTTDMVKAILDGIKTQTRKVIKSQPWGMDKVYFTAFRKDYGGRTCPYGQVGDRLWVRESFYTESGDIWYKADGQTAPMFIKWKPSLFMPRWASRITLEITEVRVERLQEISDGDCQAEGCQYPQWRGSHTSWKGAYKALWDSLNAKRGYGWEVNPWVWVISFDAMGITLKRS